MIWNFVIIGAVVAIFIILLRRIPAAVEAEKQEKKELSKEEITIAGLLAQADDAFEKKDFSKAEEIYIKAASRDPQNAKVYNRLGVIYLEMGNSYDARDAFLQAIKLEPGQASRYANLGLAYLGLKDYYKAIQTLEEALKIDPRNKKYQGFLDKARKSYDKENKKK
jgi:Flp pilus assembly protein TadD